MKFFSALSRRTKLISGALLTLGVMALAFLAGERYQFDFQADILPTSPQMCVGELIAQDTATVTLKKPQLSGVDLTITKTVPDSQKNVKVGDRIDYTLTYRNLGPDSAPDVRIVDDYDELKLQIIAGSIVPNSCSDDEAKISCNFPALPKDGIGTVTYSALATVAGIAQNTAVVSTSVPETNLTNNTATATVNIAGSGNAPSCTLTASPTEITAGQSSTLSWTINGDVNSAVIDNGIGNVSIPTGALTVDPGITTKYTLTVSNPSGTASCEATVTVGSAPPTSFTFQKEANPTIARVGESITYTLNYSNTGATNAASVIIRDDYDETRLTGVTVPDMCIVGGGEIVCNVGALAAGSSGQITYTATIANTVKSGEMIHNVATFTADSQNPLTAEAFVKVKGLILTKSVNPTTVVTGQIVTYTLTVENTLPTPQTFTIQDVQAAGDNGGHLDFTHEVQATFMPQNSGTFTGNDPAAFHVASLAGGAKVMIEYKYKASDEQINFNEQSLFKNTATIVETGDQAHAEVIVKGPTSGGGCQTNCGGGGGGGRRIIYGNVDVKLQKEVRDKNGTWQDADTFDVAALVPHTTEQLVSYRIHATNTGKFAGNNIKISDIFESQDLERLEIQNVKGAEFDAEKQEFALETIGAGKTITISYDMLMRRTVASKKTFEGVNTATITELEPPDNLSSRYRVRETNGVGVEDSAYIVTKGKGRVTLLKRVDKSIVRPGEEVNYLITLRNQSGQDLQGITLTDLFPFEQLEFLSSNFRGIQKNGKIEYSRDLLLEGKLWAIRVKARVKANVPDGTIIRNFAAVTAENEDLSKLHAETQITVEAPRTVGRRLISTGPEAALALLVLGSFCFFVGMRRRYGK